MVFLPSLPTVIEQAEMFLVGSTALAGGLRGTVWVDLLFQIILPRNPCWLSLWNKWSSSVLWNMLPPLWTASVLTLLAFLGTGRQLRAISRKPVLFPLAFWRKKNVFDMNTM